MQQEARSQSEQQLSADKCYKYEELHSKPYITPNSEIPENLLHLCHSFGYDSGRRANLKLLDDRTLIFIAGNLLVLLDVNTKEQRYVRSCGGGGIGAITAHPRKVYFVVAEKGKQPNIIVYEYPSLRPYHVLRGGTERAYSYVEFNHDGSLLASVGSAPDFTLTLWDWRQEEVTLSCKAISQEVYRVSFSPYNPGLLTTSGFGHIKFWKMADTFTGPKLQGLIGHFGTIAPTDIEGYVELPDGKVLSGTDWGNLLLWDGNTIKVEICRKGGRTCHRGTVQPFALEDGQLMTTGSDGVVRVWDFETIDMAESNSDSSRFEMEPINELVVGHKACLSSVVRSSLPDSTVWFAQDSNGAIWKVDLSFLNMSPDPECLFSFHAGMIQGLDVSKKSHLMATTALDRSVKVFDFLAKRELTTSRFNQGGTALCWAPALVNQSGGLLVTGFEDGVVRLLELYEPHRLHGVTGSSSEGDARLRLRQAWKPHNAAVTSVAFKENGEILATGSADCTVFFFTVGGKYNPVGFIHVPGPVQALEWSPRSHRENRLLVLCQSGHVVEVQSPDRETKRATNTFHLSELPRRSFKFKSIKSQIKREEDIARKKAIKEKKKKEKEEWLKNAKQPDEEQDEEEEEEEELPPIYIPDPPSPLCCGLYSQPGHFWLSMGGFDSGFLYHCKFSENQDEDPEQRQDEPFGFLPVHNADDDPILSITFSTNRQLLLCGMNSGSIRVYPLQPGDDSLTSMQAYWALSVHDNQYGHLRHIRCSHDDLFVLTAGDDGNIFSFSLFPPEELQKSMQAKRAEVPSPQMGLESEAWALDIEDPAAYSLEMVKQKLQSDLLHQEAELKISQKLKKLREIEKKYKEVLKINQSLPEHVRLTPEELQLDQRFYEHAERQKAQVLMEVRKQLAWKQEHCSIALKKLQDWFGDSLGTNMVTVVSIRTNHRISTYHLPVLDKLSARLRHRITPSRPDGDRDAALDCRKISTEPAKSSSSRIDVEEVLRHSQEEGGAAASDSVCPAVEKVLRPPGIHAKRIKPGAWQEERLRKAAEQAEQARAQIEKRKQEWAQLYAEKPSENYEDPKDAEAIREATENIGDFIGVKHQRVNADMKREELIALEENMSEKQSEMNSRIVALRDSKLHLVSCLHAQTQQLQKVQQRLAAHLHRPPPILPTILPEETPEKRLQWNRTTLERYWSLRELRLKGLEQEEQEGAASLLEQLEKEMEEEKRKEEQKRDDVETASFSVLSVTREEKETVVDEGAELSELEKELKQKEEIRLLYEQNSLLEEMESSICQFDAALLLLCQEKARLDCRLNLDNLRMMTLFQEVRLLEEYQSREEGLQEKLNSCLKQENSITAKLQECNEQLKLKERDIAKLQEREKALTAAFESSLGENNKYEEFLTKVFKKKIKRVKKEQTGKEEEQDSYEDCDEDDDWDDDDDNDSEEGGAAVNDSVCPAGCEPELFEKTLQLRERRLDLEEKLAKEEKSVEALKRESDRLTEEVKSAKSSREAAGHNLDLLNGEKLQKMNEINVVVPLRLHQIKYTVDGSMPSDLSEALVVDANELDRLHERIRELQEENVHQKDLHRQALQRHRKLTHERKDLAAQIQTLEKHCDDLMMKKFGKLVDLDALQTMSGNKRVEELKLEKRLKEAAYAKEIRQLDAKLEEARQAYLEATEANIKVLRTLTSLNDEKRDLTLKISARQKKMARQPFRDQRKAENKEAIRKLRELVKTQSQQAETLRRQIEFLSSKGGHMMPPDWTRLPPLGPLPTPKGSPKTGK